MPYANHSLNFTNFKNDTEDTFWYYVKLQYQKCLIHLIEWLLSEYWVPNNGYFGSKSWFLGFLRTHIKKEIPGRVKK